MSDDRAASSVLAGATTSEAEGSSKRAPPEASEGARSSAGYTQLAQHLRTAAYGSLALGAVLIGASLDAVLHGLIAAAVSPLAPGVFAMLIAVLLFRAAGAVEASATEADVHAREGRLVAAMIALFVDHIRYVTLTLALGAIAFLLVNFR